MDAAIECDLAELFDAKRTTGEVIAGIQDKLGVSTSGAEQLIRDVVCGVNAQMFPAITHIELIHTEGCNLGCTYCFEREMLGYRRMKPEIARAAIDFLFAYAGTESHVRVLHFGGEPTLNFAGIKAATEYAEERARETGKTVGFDLTSNGVLLDAEMIDYFGDHHINVLLSIDGLAPSHDSYRQDKKGRPTFERVIDAMRRLKRRQPWVGTKMTVMPSNAHRLFDDVVGLHDLGVNQFIIGYATGIQWPEDLMQTYIEQLGRVYDWYQVHRSSQLRIADFDDAPPGAGHLGCQAGRNSVTVTVDGEISPCSKVLALDKRKLVGKLGHVSEGITNLEMRASLVTCSPLKSKLVEQGIERDFVGGCFASNHQATGDMFSPCLQDHKFSLMQRGRCGGCVPHL